MECSRGTPNPRADLELASGLPRNFAFASSNVDACPFVRLGIAGTMAVTDQNQPNSGGALVEASS
jgi:hypothetical protein